MGSFRVWHQTIPTEIYQRVERTRCLFKLYAETWVRFYQNGRHHVTRQYSA